MSEWGGSGIEQVTFEYIKKLIPQGATVIELGAGYISTREFSKIYDLYSVEHQEEYLNHFDNVNYIHAPIVDGWYDRSKLNFPKEHSMVFIDGACREGILDNMDLFNENATFIIHDTYREKEVDLSKKLGQKLGRKVEFHSVGDYFSVI